MGSKYTDAQKNASIKYLDEKTDSIQKKPHPQTMKPADGLFAVL